MDLPNSFSHALFKQYTEITKSKEGQEALQGENMTDEIEEMMGG